MKIQFWSIGKNHDPHIKEAVEDFSKRIGKYFPTEWNIIPVPKNTGMMSEMDLKKREGEMILTWLKPQDFFVALDQSGKELSSEQLAEFIQARANESAAILLQIPDRHNH